MKKSLFQIIVDFILGEKYYANIINTRGTDKCELCSFIFHSKEEAAQHAEELRTTRSFEFIETISFRSRIIYGMCKRQNPKSNG